MALRTIAAVLALCACALAAPPPGRGSVLVIHDGSDAALDAGAFQEELVQRGFTVRSQLLQEHPVLLEYGERAFDSVVVLPGQLKGLGRTLRARDFVEHMRKGGNLLLASTPQQSPAVVREIANQLGFAVSPKGVEFRSDFTDVVHARYPHILESVDGNALEGAAVAKLGANELLLGLVGGPRSSYSFNSIKHAPNATLVDPFALGEDNYLAVGLQTLHNARFAWVGAPALLTGAAGAELTSWVFQETCNLRLAAATHANVLGESQEFYNVLEPVTYCAQIEQWDPLAAAWKPYANASDAQLEFRMLDPYYRLDLNASGCVAFTLPDQYGMFTFALDYMRRGYSFLNDHQIVTVLQRANDAWDRSWTITNSWVYLGGVTTSVMGFLAFVVLYLAAPDAAVEAAAAAAEKPAAAASDADADDVDADATGKREKSRRADKPRVAKSEKKKRS